jgi:hypothetical protein
MEFLDIASLGRTYRYVVKIEQKFKQKRREFGSANSAKVAPTHKERDRENMATLRTTSPSCNTRREMIRRRGTQENGVSTIKALGTTLKNSAPRSHPWPS